MGQAEPKRGLRRAMGFADLLLFFVITGFGLMWLAKAAEVGAVGVTLWVLGGLTFFLPLAACVLELSSRYPGEGGLYLWTRQAFGGFAGFLAGWTYWASVLPFLPSVLYFVAGSALFVGGEHWQHLARDEAYFLTASLLGLAVATALNLVGLGVGKWLHNLGALGTWLPALALMAIGVVVWAEHGPVTDLSPEEFVPRLSLKEVVVWPVLVMSLMGLEAASILGEEIKDPRRLIPRALACAVVLLLATKILGTLAVLAALTPHEASEAGPVGLMRAFARAAGRAGLAWLLPAVALLVAVGNLGKVGAWSAAGARLPFVAGVDRCLPAALARLHPRWGTPYVALLLQAVLVAALVVLGPLGTTTAGAYNVFLSMTVIPAFLPFLLLFAALIKVQREPAGPGVVRVPGGRAVAVPLAVLGLLTTVSALVLAVVPPEGEKDKALYVTKVVGLAVVLVGAGVAVYLLGKRPHDQAPAATAAGPGRDGG
jgi:glutamate:GABA antiporter